MDVQWCRFRGQKGNSCYLEQTLLAGPRADVYLNFTGNLVMHEKPDKINQRIEAFLMEVQICG